MTAEFSTNQLWIFRATVFAVIPFLQWSLLSLSALKLRKEGELSSFHSARMAHFGGLREQRASWRGRSCR